MKTVQIDKTLVLSTAHFTDDDNSILARFARAHTDSPDSSAHFVIDFGYGYIVWVNSDGDFSEYAGKLSPAFICALRFAHKQKVEWVRFDRDANTVEGLPTFDW